MDTDDDDLGRIPFLDRPQRGQDMQAVDSAIRPEIENHQATMQVSELQRSSDIQPGETGRKVGRADRTEILIPSSHAHPPFVGRALVPA